MTADPEQGSAAVGERLSTASVGTIQLALERLGYRGCFMAGVVPMTPSRRFVGRARTLRCLPTRPDIAEARRRDKLPNPHRVAIDEISPGEVLVIDARSSREAAVIGDLLALRVKVAGGVAVVTDGCIRDVADVAEVGLPVYAAGANATTFSSRHLGMDVGLPIACGGVLVMPGDWLVGDAEGVVVIPAHLAEKVADLVREQEELDAFIKEKLLEGVPTSRAYSPDALLEPEFQQWLETRRKPWSR